MESFGGWQFWVEDGDRVRQFHGSRARGNQSSTVFAKKPAEGTNPFKPAPRLELADDQGPEQAKDRKHRMR